MSLEEGIYLDTSALAKWYIDEPGSAAFVAWIEGAQGVWISSLTRLEMRSLIHRRVRMGDFSWEIGQRILAAFADDVEHGYLPCRPNGDAAIRDADRLIAALPDHPLRSLDAIHLATARHHRAGTVASADRVLLGAALSSGLQVLDFSASGVA